MTRARPGLTCSRPSKDAYAYQLQHLNVADNVCNLQPPIVSNLQCVYVYPYVCVCVWGECLPTCYLHACMPSSWPASCMAPREVLVLARTRRAVLAVLLRFRPAVEKVFRLRWSCARSWLWPYVICDSPDIILQNRCVGRQLAHFIHQTANCLIVLL